MQSYYSFLGSPLHLLLEDEIAEGYNRFIDAFINAQIKHAEIHDRKWTPDEPLLMDVTDEDRESYDKVGRIINLLIEINGGGLSIPEEVCTSDHLVKL